MTHADDQALMLNEILDLMDALQEPTGAGMTAWATLRAVLDWGGRNELFTIAEVAPRVAPALPEMTEEARTRSFEHFYAAVKRGEVRFPLPVREVTPNLTGPHGRKVVSEETGAPVPGDTGPGTPAAPSSPAAEGSLPPDDAVPARDGARGTSEIPAGPQAGEDETGAAAPTSSETGQGPEGPEAVHAEADDGPVPPVVGGGTSKPDPTLKRPRGATANFSAPAWTEEQDRTAIEMKLAGRSNREIAEAVGRPVKALSVRLSTKLKARLAQARAAIAEERDSETAGEPAPEGGAESGVTAAAQFAEHDPAGAAEETGDSPAAAAPTPAPVLRVVAAAAVHWHERMTEREIERHLASLPADPFWTPERDFRLAHALWVGEGAGIAAKRLGCQKAEAVGRWRQLCPVVNLDNQRHLNAALKARLGELAPAEAAE